MNKVYTKDILHRVFKDDYKIVSRLYGGMMNVSYLIEDSYSRKYIMYIPNGKANKLVDRPNELKSQQIAYNLGITSRNLYFDTYRGIKINDFIPGISLDKYEGEIDYQKVANLLHILHSSKELCPNDYNPLQRYFNYEKKALSFQPLSVRYYKSRDFFFTYVPWLDIIVNIVPTTGIIFNTPPRILPRNPIPFPRKAGILPVAEVKNEVVLALPVIVCPGF